MADWKAFSKEIESYIIDCRRWLHKHAELSTKEYETTEFIVNELKKIGVDDIKTYDDITGCVATIKGTEPGATIMLRADIDALPIQEIPGKEYCSIHDGAMHACGHDGHTAMLLGAAKLINEHKDCFKGTVKLIFQMGEEIGRQSENYVTRGALEGVDGIFGMHIWTGSSLGKANFEYGERMACSDRFTIDVKGVSAHGSAPNLGKDAIVAAAAIVMALQTLPSRINNPLDSLVVTVGIMEGGTKENIICDNCRLVGTVRAFNREFRNSMPDRIKAIAEDTASAYGCTVDCDYYFGPSPLINDDRFLVDCAKAAACQVLGDDCHEDLVKMTGAEDFSVYMEHIPGVYGFLGTRAPEKGITGPAHHPAFDFDESVLCNGTAIYCAFAEKYLIDKELN